MAKPTIIIIVGISGDLARRKLLPAIGRLAAAGMLPRQLRMIGVTRRADVQPDSLVGTAPNSAYLRDHLELFQMNLGVEAEYDRLGSRLLAIEQDLGAPAQRLFYLSVPPQVSRPIIELLGRSGLARTSEAKLLLEKPFGTDLASATELITHIDRYFRPDQVYRIDHYMAKEMAQNLIVFREGNSLFKRTWNHNFIARIDITASEDIGIEGRSGFYEQTGALRDVVQSHLLQLAALTLMEPPPIGRWSEVPARRLAALRHLSAAAPSAQTTKRGQYEGYRQEVNNPGSSVETFASLTLQSSDPRWQGVPVRLTAGKALAEKSTIICVTYHQSHDYESNQLVLRLQPNEGAELCVWTKIPGYEKKLVEHSLRFVYQEHFRDLPEAYELIFLDAINSDHTLFTTGEEVLEAWRILEPVQHAWSMSSEDLVSYRPGRPAAEVH